MIYAFVQDSVVGKIRKQQKETILSYAKEHDWTVGKWLTPSSFRLETFREKDVLLLEKTFRLGKDVCSVTSLLKELLNKGVIILSCEDGLTFGGDYLSSTVMSHVFGIVSELTGEMRSRLTKEALLSRKQNGQKLGRPHGRKNAGQKLDAKKNQIQELFQNGKTEPEICRLLEIPRSSLWTYVKEHPELRPEAV